MSDYKFTLPWGPSVNTYRAIVRNRFITSKKGREYRASVIARMHQLNLHGELLSGDLAIDVKLFPPTLRKYDVDNYLKPILDALTHAEFWGDDSQVVKLTVEKRQKFKCGKVELSITKL